MKRSLSQGRSKLNGISAATILDEFGLDPYEFRIYAHLASHADSQSKPWTGITSVAVA